MFNSLFDPFFSLWRICRDSSLHRHAEERLVGLGGVRKGVALFGEEYAEKCRFIDDDNRAGLGSLGVNNQVVTCTCIIIRVCVWVMDALGCGCHANHTSGCQGISGRTKLIFCALVL